MPPLADAEIAFLRELDSRGVRFVLIGMGAAVLQGATAMTQDLDLWFESLSDPRISEAARAAGGLYVSGSFGMQPPTIGGGLGDRFDVETHAHGLGPFATEWESTIAARIQGVPVRLLGLDRILASKRAARLEAAIAVRDDAKG